MKTKVVFIRLLIIALVPMMLFSCSTVNETITKNDPEINDPNNISDELDLEIKAVDDGNIIFYSYEDYYRYGPSIMKYEDGSMDAWFSSPGNNSSQWDWITYRHSDDGINWSDEEVVLKPTPGSKDSCSVCDPGVVYFNGYYYMGYTSTDDYSGKGSNNSAFVARSEYPDGPYEKWNGEGWGGDPEPIIAYKGDPSGWGIGELSFVIRDDDLLIYYTCFDENGGSTGLYKADLTENWPLTMRFKDTVLNHLHEDSLDVAYDTNLGLFLAFSIDYRMSESSRIALYASYDGKKFEEMDTSKDMIEDYAHNVGVAKSPIGYLDSSENILIGYAFGKDWGRWSAKFQNVRVFPDDKN
ncbi:MAG: hypothetical protein IJH00_00045 [Erysipelotrichaceae bacterium]|nr:hypothetical protein [Erysipelotrichaceae bacterium]